MKKIILAFSAFIVMLIGCNLSNDGFKTTESGLKYKFILQNKGAQKAEIGDLLEVVMSYSYNDSIIFNSNDFAPSLPMQLIEPLYEGDIVEGFAMLGLGDSAVFIVNAESFYKYNVGLEQLPYFIEPEGKITFNVSLISIKKKEVFEKEQDEYMKQRQALNKILEREELEMREAYLKRNNINIAPTRTGLYYIETKPGSGQRALPGKTVEVHYKGLLLDGTVFDSSFERAQPISFKIGSRIVIDGFEEGISMMHQGGKATLIIPSHLAYGEQELENISPFSTLVYEVELLKVE